MLTRIAAFLCRFGPIRQAFWKRWYEFLARSYREDDWIFMNYGYAPDGEARALSLDPQDEPDRWCIQLYHFVATLADLSGKEVLEVGSGRGGGASYVARYLGPASVTGVDFSANAVEFCRKRHRVKGLTFKEGMAEALPFGDASFDIVLNVESSHCYGSMESFLREVRRVLRSSGLFLYADLRGGESLPSWLTQLKTSGLQVISELDITPNVLAALERDSDRKAALIHKLIPGWLLASFSDFAGTRGSAIYEGFRSRRYVYRAFVLRK